MHIVHRHCVNRILGNFLASLDYSYSLSFGHISCIYGAESFLYLLYHSET
ncbi:hypothetical protein LguiB_006382 [Lonicera macranthoides]